MNSNPNSNTSPKRPAGPAPGSGAFGAFWQALGRDQDGLPLSDGAGEALHLQRRQFEEVVRDMVQLLTRVLVDAVLPARSAAVAADVRAGNGLRTGFTRDKSVPEALAQLVDGLSGSGLLQVRG